MSTIRLQAKVTLKGITEVKALIQHPMEAGNRDDVKTGIPLTAHFIEEVTCEHNGKVVMSADWGGGISKNPYLSFRFKDGAVGEKVKLTWKDNQDQSDSREVKIKKSRR
ncbi:MAG: thiosulfate oxidation carrier complex protein SoxZ [Pseudomonadota bacterium]